jgi:hypothetical protein
LQPGQQVTASVLGQVAPGRLLIQIDNAVVEARSAQAFPAGSSLNLQVKQVQPEVILSHVDSPLAEQAALPQGIPSASANLLLSLPGGPSGGVEMLAGALRARLQAAPMGQAVRDILVNASSPDAGTAMTALASRLRALIPQGQPYTAQQLSTFVREGGLQYETRLARQAPAGSEAESASAVQEDVKGLVLQAIADSSHLAGGASNPTPALTQHLQAIEGQQTANLLALARGDPVLLQIPLLSSSGQASTMYMAVESDAQGSSKEGASPSYSLLMHLEMEQLGTVRIDAQFSQAGARIVFYVESDEGRARLQSELGSLREGLRDVGGTALLAVRRLQDLPGQQRAAFQALVGGIPRSGSSLDVKA